jgi:hypothetical protein
VKERQIDAEIKKGIDARTKEFREKVSKLTYEKIKSKLAPMVFSKNPLKDYPYNEHKTVNEAQLKAGSGKGVADIDFVGDAGHIMAAERKFKIKFKKHSAGYDISGEKKDIVAYLQSDDYGMDSEDIKDIYPELLS